ncbi:hypothetical protein [Brevibacillus thermoruber]|uniref:hypothetical protein n=1 Tax=Brevibacillus thermoruber TaxID=33942 RepID=UPI00054FD985|nr:hypothetical protein [Brevibacillus thermoruber]
MLATQTKRIFSSVPLKNQDATVVSPDQLLSHVQETPNAIVYLLWPEDKVLLPLLRDHATVYVLGNLKSEQYVEEMKEALRNGAHDFLDRMDHISAAIHETNKQKRIRSLLNTSFAWYPGQDHLLRFPEQRNLDVFGTDCP